MRCAGPLSLLENVICVCLLKINLVETLLNAKKICPMPNKYTIIFYDNAFVILLWKKAKCQCYQKPPALQFNALHWTHCTAMRCTTLHYTCLSTSCHIGTYWTTVSVTWGHTPGSHCPCHLATYSYFQITK